MSEISFNYQTLITAIGNFLRQYVQPAIDSDCVLLGNMPNMVLPEDNDYIIFNILSVIRHGTTHESYDAENEALTLTETSEATIQVDCYATVKDTSDIGLLNAQIRAHNIEMLFRSSVACDYFKDYGIRPLYADTPQNTTIVSDSNNYLHRWTVNLHINFANSFTVPVEGFTKIDIKTNQIVTESEVESEPPSKVGFLHIAEADTHLKES